MNEKTNQNLRITPGPWQVSGLLKAKATDWEAVTTERGVAIASVWAILMPGTDGLNRKTDARNCAANARLIAAAPELLDLLEGAALRVQLANQEGDPILSAWLPGALAAIAKAKGLDQ